MRGKTNQVKSKENRYGYRPFQAAGKRLDLNDLIKRAKDEEKNDKKINLLIFSGAASVVLVFIILLSL